MEPIDELRKRADLALHSWRLIGIASSSSSPEDAYEEASEYSWNDRYSKSALALAAIYFDYGQEAYVATIRRLAPRLFDDACLCECHRGIFDEDDQGYDSDELCECCQIYSVDCFCQCHQCDDFDNPDGPCDAENCDCECHKCCKGCVASCWCQCHHCSDCGPFGNNCEGQPECGCNCHNYCNSCSDRHICGCHNCDTCETEDRICDQDDDCECECHKCCSDCEDNYFYDCSPFCLNFNKEDDDKEESEDEATEVVQAPQLPPGVTDGKLGEVSRRLQEYLGTNYPVYRKESNNANAYAYGNYIEVTTEAERILTRDELAFLVSHEIVNNLGNHPVEKAQRTENLLDGVADIVSEKPGFGGILTGIAVAGIGYLINRADDRKDEGSADQTALEFMERAGYDPRAAAKAIEKITDKNVKHGITSTHPSPEERKKYLS